MANYYTHLSLELNLGREANDWFYRLATATEAAIYDEKDRRPVDPDLEPYVYRYLWPDDRGYPLFDHFGLILEPQDDDNDRPIWIQDEECPNLDLLDAMIQDTLKHFNRKDIVSYETAFTCDKPRLDAFGGSATVITQDDIQWMSTNAWLRETTSALQGETQKL